MSLNFLFVIRAMPHRVPNLLRPLVSALLLGAVLVPTAAMAQTAGTTFPLRGRNAAAVPDQGSWERREIRDAGGPLDAARSSAGMRKDTARARQARHRSAPKGLPVAHAAQP